MLLSFSAGGQTERHAPLATCAVFIAVGWCPNGAAPNPYCGSRAVLTPSAETALGGLYDLATYLDPRTVLGKEEAARSPCASECQARGRGSPRQPATPLAVCPRAGADVQAKAGRRVQGARPLCSWACTTQCDRHHRARYPGASQKRPVRRRAHPLRSFLSLEKHLPSERRGAF